MFFETLLAVSTILKAYQSYNEYQSASQAAEYQKQIAEQNARLARQQAKEIELQGLKTAKRIERDTESFIQEQLALYSNSGVDTASSTVQEVIRSSARTGATDIIDSMDNYANEVWNKEFEAEQEKYKASIYKSQAKRYRLLAPYAAGTDVLSGAANIYYLGEKKNA